MTGAILLEMIKKTAFAISTDETRYILNGVFFEPREGGKVRMVATDGHRLALVERELAGDFKLKGGVIIPRKGLLRAQAPARRGARRGVPRWGSPRTRRSSRSRASRW